MGGVVPIGRLIIDSNDMLEGNLESARGSEALDDCPWLKVLALLAGGRRTELSEREVVAPGIVGGLLILYLCWEVGEEGPVASSPSEYGILRASTTWDGESLGTWGEEALCLVVRLVEGVGRAPRVCAVLENERRASGPCSEGA